MIDMYALPELNVLGGPMDSRVISDYPNELWIEDITAQGLLANKLESGLIYFPFDPSDLKEGLYHAMIKCDYGIYDAILEIKETKPLNGLAYLNEESYNAVLSEDD